MSPKLMVLFFRKKRLKCDDVKNAILKQFYILKPFYFCSSVFYKIQVNLIKNTNIIIF